MSNKYSESWNTYFIREKNDKNENKFKKLPADPSKTLTTHNIGICIFSHVFCLVRCYC